MGVELLDFFFGELLALLLHARVHLVQVVVQVLKHHVELLGHQQHLFQLYDVGVIQFPEGLDFSQLDALVPVRIFLLHLLDGHHFAGLDVCRLVDRPEGPVS